MKGTAIPNMAEKLARWRSFLAGGPGAPRFVFHANFSAPEWDAELPPPAPHWPDKKKERIERRWAEYKLLCRKAALVDDDRVPFLSNMTGTEVFAEAFGCRVHRPSDTNPFALPLIKTAAQADALDRPELSTSSLAYLFDIADELYRRGGPGSIMKPVDIQSPMDVVALIWEKSELFVAMIETPEAVKALAMKVRLLITDFFVEWFKRYGTTFVAHYPDYVMHTGISMSVDEVGSVSEDMFREFFSDELVSLSSRFGGLGVHCCADARHQWGNFRDLPGLLMINHNVPPTRNAREYLLDSIRFYESRAAQMPIGWRPEGLPETWPGQFPAEARIVIEVAAENAEQAAELASRLQEIRATRSSWS